ncbi:MAG: pyrophosphate-dependent phosphofructokinase [Deltaproteobacteria bacterium]|nr:pyrophosphate-dependent phosphofructokinase [Deltaproteobacteria bacterium]
MQGDAVEFQVKDKEINTKRTSPTERFLAELPVQVAKAFLFEGKIRPVAFTVSEESLPVKDEALLQRQFPNMKRQLLVVGAEEPSEEIQNLSGRQIGVIFSGGPASGGNNVLSGILKALGRYNTLIGFEKGPDGLIKGEGLLISSKKMKQLINTGGFDYLGTGRTKIDTPEKFAAVLKTVQKYSLDGIIIVGGDDSNTNAIELAEFLSEQHNAGILAKPCAVVGVPKTIDGDLQINVGGKTLLPISFGFYTAARVYSKTIGNLLTDAASQGKNWFFYKVMGRSASHIALEVALQTRPHISLISEEIAAREQSLSDIVTYMTGVVVHRAKNGKHYGVGVIPEGIIEFIPEMKKLINELNKLSARLMTIKRALTDAGLLTENGFLGEQKVKELEEQYGVDNILTHPHILGLDYKISEIGFVAREQELSTRVKKDFIITAQELSDESRKLFMSLPDDIVEAMLLDRDEHGNLKVSQIPSENLLIRMMKERLRDMQQNPKRYEESGDLILADDTERKNFLKFVFAVQTGFLGYEGRCGAPTRFDADYSLNLGLTAGSLALGGQTGYMASMINLSSGAQPIGIPLAALIHGEERKGVIKPVIEKALITLDSPAFQAYVKNRDHWAEGNSSRSPGAIQYEGRLAAMMPLVVALNMKIITMGEIEAGKYPVYNIGERRDIFL